VAGVVVKRLGELETAMGGGFGLVGKTLGVSAFGINVLRLPPGYEDYPEHDEAASGQDEVYVVVRGTARLLADGAEHELSPLAFAHVPAGTKRKWLGGPEGATIVAVGGVPPA
jgi:uncharacterized cupin superfamily protein